MTDRKDTEISEDRVDATQDQTEATASPARRRLLRVLAGAGGVVATGALLPEKWTQPLVNRVLVPAHAQATAISYSGGSSGPGPAPSEGLGHRILNAVIPPANAGGPPPNGLQSPLNVCIDGAGATRTVRIFSCCDGGSGQSDTLKVVNNTMKGSVGDCDVYAEFAGGVWEVEVSSFNGCPGNIFDVDASATPGASGMARIVEAVIPAAHAADIYTWPVTCGPSPCLGTPAECLRPG
jgi:hypothetical protein